MTDTNGTIKQKDIASALKNTDFFKTLTPEGMLTVMVEDLLMNHSIRRTNFEVWESLGDAKDGISTEYRFDELIKVIETDAPSVPLEKMVSTGLLEFCMPGCFPIKKRISVRDLKTIIKNFDKCGGELPTRLSMFLFPFPPETVKGFLTECNFDEHVITLIVDALTEIEDFTLIKDGTHLKKYIYKNGMEKYYFITALAEQISTGLDFPEYRHLSKEYIMKEIIRNNEPIFPKDLAIESQQLIEDGIVETPEEAEVMMGLLVEHIHGKPLENTQEKLLKQAQAYKKSKLKKAFRNVNWIK